MVGELVESNILNTKQKNKQSMIIHLSTILGLIMSIAFVIYGFSTGIFTSQSALNEFLSSFGIYSVIIFVVVQAISVVIPILPGSIGCLVGIVLYGPLYGFIYNYVGISLGSIAAFLISRFYGTEIVKTLTKPEDYDKYDEKIRNIKYFDRWFAFMIFIPVAPDDLLCYLAGLTKINFNKYVTIILLMKPFSIAAYSFGLNALYAGLLNL